MSWLSKTTRKLKRGAKKYLGEDLYKGVKFTMVPFGDGGYITETWNNPVGRTAMVAAASYFTGGAAAAAGMGTTAATATGAAAAASGAAAADEAFGDGTSWNQAGGDFLSGLGAAKAGVNAANATAGAGLQTAAATPDPTAATPTTSTALTPPDPTAATTGVSPGNTAATVSAKSLTQDPAAGAGAAPTGGAGAATDTASKSFLDQLAPSDYVSGAGMGLQALGGYMSAGRQADATREAARSTNATALARQILAEGGSQRAGGNAFARELLAALLGESSNKNVSGLKFGGR